MMNTMTNNKLNMEELAMVNGGIGSLGSCDPVGGTGPLHSCDPVGGTGPLGFPPRTV